MHVCSLDKKVERCQATPRSDDRRGFVTGAIARALVQDSARNFRGKR
jgi:hypothetical protein